jgi:hypothetical protein
VRRSSSSRITAGGKRARRASISCSVRSSISISARIAHGPASRTETMSAKTSDAQRFHHEPSSGLADGRRPRLPRFVAATGSGVSGGLPPGLVP